MTQVPAKAPIENMVADPANNRIVTKRLSITDASDKTKITGRHPIC